MKDSSDEKEVQKKKLSAKDLENRRHADLRVVMGNKSGRRSIWFILEGAGLNELSYSVNEGDKAMNFREGQRNVALSLRRELLKAGKDLYRMMLQENE